MVQPADKIDYGSVMADLQWRHFNQQDLPWKKMASYHRSLKSRVEDMLMQKTKMRQRVAGTDALFDQLIEVLEIPRKWQHNNGHKPKDHLHCEVLAKVELLMQLDTSQAPELLQDLQQKYLPKEAS